MFNNILYYLIMQANVKHRQYSIKDDNPITRHYKAMRCNQTYEFATYARRKYCTTFDLELTVWDALLKLDEFIDESDPDLVAVSNIHHAFQTAEQIRKDGKPEWMQVTGLIHDLGKVLFLKGCNEDGTSQKEQWAVGGDTFIVGCRLSDNLVLSEYNALNPDMKDQRYNTELGIYRDNCGFDACVFSFGHDEYLYQVLRNHQRNNKDKVKLPKEAFYIIRYHSFYAWHDKNDYKHLESEYDRQMKPIVKEFNAHDLYTKEYKLQNIDELKNYYFPLLEEYLGTEPINF